MNLDEETTAPEEAVIVASPLSVAVAVGVVVIVKFNVTTESHPFAAPPAIVKVAVLFEDVYVFPSIHV